MDGTESDTDLLIAEAAAGNVVARERLLAVHRDRLRRMLDVRMDRRLAARLDASDVVQESLAEATRQLDGYLRRRDLPFYWQRLMQLHRQHVQCQKRSVKREQPGNQYSLPDESEYRLVEQLVGSKSSPSQGAIRDETIERVRTAMRQLKAADRELLVLRHLEQLTVAETAATLGISGSNVKVRHFRAVRQLQKVLGDQSGLGERDA